MRLLSSRLRLQRESFVDLLVLARPGEFTASQTRRLGGADVGNGDRMPHLCACSLAVTGTWFFSDE
ncbi:MAG TPA: hypothetical protein VFQ68_03650 [Streptosporangiaceae bacterium]|nr:hypothetical protein [Streptosporangiaceae bacterium]